MIIIRSFLIAAVVAVLFGFGLKNVFGFWEASALAFVTQFIIAFVYSSLKISKNTTLTAVPCPCGNYTHTDNIFLNLENEYTCEKCNNEFRIDISLTPTLLTTPMDVSKQFQNITDEPKPTKDVSFTKQEYTEGTEL